jgi:hypothetical protein
MLTEGARKIYRGRHGARGRRVGQGWFRRCGILNMSQPYRLPRLVTGIAKFEVFTTATMKNFVFWDVTPCDPCKNKCFRKT